MVHVQMNGMSFGGLFRRLTPFALLAFVFVLALVLERNRRRVDFVQPSIFDQPIESKSEPKRDVSRRDDSLGSLVPLHCSTNRSLVFLKTHKTASSTIQNIIMRWGSKVIHSRIPLITTWSVKL